MTKTKRVLAMSLATACALTMFGCSGSSSSKPSESKDANNSGNDVKPSESNDDNNQAGATRDIYIGSWFDEYYTSDHQDIYANEKVTDIEQAQMQLDNMREIEKKYNVTLRIKNLTWDGTIQSINTSILAGTPDVDIYNVDLQFGVPAVLKGYAQDIHTFAKEDSDIFKDQNVMKYLHIEGTDGDYLFSRSSNSCDSYPLAFNMDMIKAKNLENPQDLYDRGEWTWDKWLEYLQVLTEDTDGDGATDVWGYSGWWTTMLSYLLMSNNTDIAATSTQHLDKPETVEVIQFIDDLYNKYGVAKPWDANDWDANVKCYTTQQVAFWTSACWVMQNYGDSDPDKISFEVGVVPWPRGYSVEKDESYPGLATAGNWWFIPRGVEDAELVYNVMYDWSNWFHDDLDLRNSNTWYADMCYSPKAEDPERNYKYLQEMAKNEYFDIWSTLGNVSMFDIICKDAEEPKTAAQYIESNKQLVQEAIDGFFGN